MIFILSIFKHIILAQEEKYTMTIFTAATLEITLLKSVRKGTRNLWSILRSREYILIMYIKNKEPERSELMK